MSDKLDNSRNAEDVRLSAARQAQREAILRSKGYANIRDCVRRMRILAIHHKYSKEYGLRLIKHLGL